MTSGGVLLHPSWRLCQRGLASFWCKGVCSIEVPSSNRSLLVLKALRAGSSRELVRNTDPRLTKKGTMSPVGLQVSTTVPPRLSSAPSTDTDLDPFSANVCVLPMGTKKTNVSSMEYTSRLGMLCSMTAAAMRKCMSSHLLSQSSGCKGRGNHRGAVRDSVQPVMQWCIWWYL